MCMEFQSGQNYITHSLILSRHTTKIYCQICTEQLSNMPTTIMVVHFGHSALAIGNERRRGGDGRGRPKGVQI